jgi:hypothetical protein
MHGPKEDASALERRASEVRQHLAGSAVVGIVGMGGIGKSTIAKEVFDTVSGEYEYTCFVDNVKGIKAHKLDKWLRSLFLRSGSTPDGNSIEWRQLKGKKTLIVLDDVDSEDQFKVLPKLGALGDGSSFILTTRDQDLLKWFANCSVYEVKFLDFQEAKKLFCHHAYGTERVPENLTKIHPYLEENVNKVIQKCDGLPLSLEILGCHLKDQECGREAWEQAINMFGEAQSVTGNRKDRLWASLQLSYNSLDDKQQQMFLEAATVFFEKQVERVFCAWSTTYSDIETMWRNLLKKSLVKVVLTDKYRFGRKVQTKRIWVHQQLRDLAKHLSRGVIISGRGVLQREPDVVSTLQTFYRIPEGYGFGCQESSETKPSSFTLFSRSSALLPSFYL